MSKSKIFDILEFRNPQDNISKIVVFSIFALIILNVTAVILETEKFIAVKYSVFLYYFEVFSIAIFTIEYILRLWTCSSRKKYSGFNGKIRYMFTTLALIDLISIIPFYLPLLFIIDLRFIRIIRLFRIFRLLKTTRYSPAFKAISLVITNKKEELYISLFSVFVFLVLSSSIMYFAENKAQPDAFSSIPAVMWWGIATFTTVGAKNIYPITILGKFCSVIISLLSIGLFALPTGILASGFSEYLQKKKSNKKCPNCGKQLK